MPDFNVRSDSVNVEQLMEQIRTRIKEKRGVDYTEQQIRELAAVKLEKFLDPKAVRSDLLQQFQKMQATQSAASNITFGPNAMFEAKRPIIAKIRGWLRPVLRLFFNPDPISQALVRLNDIDPRSDMYYELFHNLVIELTRMSIEVKNLKMRVESLTGRLEFNERRARALESVVVYRPEDEVSGSQGSAGSPSSEGSQGSRGSQGSEGSRGSQGFRSGRGSEGRGRQDGGQGSRGGQSSYGSQAPRGQQGPPAPPASQQAPQSPQGPLPSVAATDSQAPTTAVPGTAGPPGEGPGQRSRRRRRRRGRRGGGSAATIMGAPGAGPDASTPSQAADDGHSDEGGFEPDSGADVDPGPSGDPDSNEP